MLVTQPSSQVEISKNSDLFINARIAIYQPVKVEVDGYSLSCCTALAILTTRPIKETKKLPKPIMSASASATDIADPFQ